MYATRATRRGEPDSDVVLQLLSRLWQIKLRSISILEKWLAKTADAEIKSGLQFQVIDERRHLRILGDEINRLGSRIGSLARENRFGRPFAMVQTQSTDFQRLTVFHRGLKVFTVERCGQIMPFVDDGVARTMERIILDEERHIRWADIRLARMDEEEQRQAKLLRERMETILEAAWPKPWLERGLRSPGSHRR